MQKVYPTLRITDYEKSKSFYVDGLGFQIEREHRFAPHLPVFMTISRDGLSLYLTQHASDKKWEGLRFEVQYFNQAGALIDTQSELAYSLVLLPNTEHTFRLRDTADKLETEYASHKVFIRNAKDADSWP